MAYLYPSYLSLPWAADYPPGTGVQLFKGNLHHLLHALAMLTSLSDDPLEGGGHIGGSCGYPWLTFSSVGARH